MTRFQRQAELANLSQEIDSMEEAVSHTPNGHPHKPMILVDLGMSYKARFDCLGELSDLSKMIESLEGAVSYTPDGHPDKPGRLTNLGSSYMLRFERLNELSDLGKSIEFHEQAVSLTPDGDLVKPAVLNNLGNSYRTRFKHIGKLSDLTKAIEWQEEAVSLIPNGHPNELAGLDSLGTSYRTRFERLGELSDLGKAIECHEQAVSRTPSGHPKKSRLLSSIGGSYWVRFKRLGKLDDLSRSIEFLEEAMSLAPGGHASRPAWLTNLGLSYMNRFERQGELPDLSKAIGFLVEAVLLAPYGHPCKPQRLNILGVSYTNRFERLGELSDIINAIESLDQAISLAPDSDPEKPKCLINLGTSYRSRFERLGEPSDLSKAIESSEAAISLTPTGHQIRPAVLTNLGVCYMARFGRTKELSDLSKAIGSLEEALLLTPGGHPDRPGGLSNLGNSYMARFERMGELSDLSKGIQSNEEAVSLAPNGHSNRSAWLINIGASYATRFERLEELSDLHCAEESFKAASQSSTGPPSIRFRACRLWAGLSSFGPTVSPFPAYQQALSLIPQLVWLGTTVDRRYRLSAEVTSFVTEAASYAISIGTLDLALEWLEAGRSIVWGQIAQLRTPFEHLSAHNSKLAEDIAKIGRQLEHAGSRLSLPSSPDISGLDLAQEASAHIHLAMEWERLLKEVRLTPGFEDFLRSPTADRLLSAANAHPIAIINLHQSRCDALVIQPGCSTISHVPLPNFSSEGAISARNLVFSQVRDRKIGPRLLPPGPHQNSLENVWSSMVKPILDFLGYTRKLPVEQLPRITWCTTGLLSFIPLHTARSHDMSQPGAFDLVISSYAPTLSAMLASQSADPGSACGILAVGQEDTPGLTNLPCTTDELAVIQKHTQGDYYLQLEAGEATIEQVLDAMDQFSWVHMACHGSQNPYDPTKSAFHLHDGNLTLADIRKRSFTNKGLAFLSACQTATGDENMPDEAVHLAAGMLMAGYPSVIGTMWSIADEDGPKVANLVYAELLKDGKMDHTNAARALHRAVAQLREKVGEEHIERWAPFIHIGV